MAHSGGGGGELFVTAPGDHVFPKPNSKLAREPVEGSLCRPLVSVSVIYRVSEGEQPEETS